MRRRALSPSLQATVVVVALALTACGTTSQSAPTDSAASTPAEPSEALPSPSEATGAPTLDELYEQAQGESGTVVCYCSAPEFIRDVFAAFTEQYPDIEVELVSGTSVDLATRAITEAQGGRHLADLYMAEVEHVRNLYNEDLVVEWRPPETDEYDESLRGDYWAASDGIFITIGWNTNLVTEADAPQSFEDLADPKWAGMLVGEPRDSEILAGLAEHKYEGDRDRAIALMEEIAQNNPQWHQGHSAVAQLVLSGQAAVCWTCYASNFTQGIADGAPVDWMRSEGIGFYRTTTLFEQAPNPLSAQLFWRWSQSQDGQQAWADAGLEPAWPEGVTIENSARPEVVYPLGLREVDLLVEEYDAVWSEIFGLR